MPFCPQCGKEVSETDRFCPNCGAQLVGKEERVPPEAVKEAVGAIPKRGAMEALNKGVSIISAQPTVLVPALLGAVISAVLSSVASWYFGWGWWLLFFGGPGFFASLIISLLLILIGGIIAYILSFASLDMSRDAYLNQELNLSKSFNYVIGRIWTFIVASIVGAILAITIILLPVANLMIVIIVVDETGIEDAISKALKVLGDRLVDVIIILIIVIVVGLILYMIPYVGSILLTALGVLSALAFIDIYFDYKRTKPY